MFERTRQGAVNVIAGSVPIICENYDSLMTALEECLSEGQPKAVLDMQEIPLIDSAGMELLLDVSDSFSARAGALKLAAPNTLCRDILNVTGVANQFEVYGELKHAIGSFLQ